MSNIMKLRTQVKTKCEEHFFAISQFIEKQQAEQIAQYIVKSNLESQKQFCQERLKLNKQLIDLHSSSKSNIYLYREGALSVLNIINSTLKKQIKNIDDQLYDLEIIKMGKTQQWMKCEIKKGMFSDERTVIFRNNKNENCSLFIHESEVDEKLGLVKVKICQNSVMFNNEYKSVYIVNPEDIL